MAENGIGDYFISDVDDEMLDDDDELIPTPVVVPAPGSAAPGSGAAPAPPVPPAPAAPSAPEQQAPAAPAQQPPAQAPAAQQAPAAAPPAAVPSEAARPQASARAASREDQLAETLDTLMHDSSEIQASALVSLDGFIMASALPQGMQEDRVGAMSAAILGLGERAAAELGRGHLSQVFIEGAEGYVILMSAGERAVLTVMADPGAKLGLVLYDMRAAADRIATILA